MKHECKLTAARRSTYCS